MTKGIAILALSLWVSCAAQAQTARVEAFAPNPPSRVNLTAVNGQLRWRDCATCPEGVGSHLAIESSGQEIRLSPGNLVSDLTLNGHYRLSGDSIPTIVSSHPIDIRSRKDHLVVVLSMPLEDYVAAVLAAEGGDLRGDEARKAIAVAVRTYALRLNSRHAAEFLRHHALSGRSMGATRLARTGCSRGHQG